MKKRKINHNGIDGTRKNIGYYNSIPNNLCKRKLYEYDSEIHKKRKIVDKDIGDVEINMLLLSENIETFIYKIISSQKSEYTKMDLLSIIEKIITLKNVDKCTYIS